MQREGFVLALTIRLNFTLPRHIIESIKLLQQYNDTKELDEEENEVNELKRKKHRENFEKYDNFLARHKNPINLLEPIYLNTIKETLFFMDGDKYRLIAFCVMSNHVHILLKPLKLNEKSYHPLSTIIFSFKRHTSGAFTELPHYVQPFWQEEYYDHVIRNEKDYFNQLNYILNNPVKAGLVEDYNDWPGVYVMNLDDIFL